MLTWSLNSHVMNLVAKLQKTESINEKSEDSDLPRKTDTTGLTSEFLQTRSCYSSVEWRMTPVPKFQTLHQRFLWRTTASIRAEMLLRHKRQCFTWHDILLLKALGDVLRTSRVKWNTDGSLSRSRCWGHYIKRIWEVDEVHVFTLLAS